jgi:hypothetical protein
MGIKGWGMKDGNQSMANEEWRIKNDEERDA